MTATTPEPRLWAIPAEQYRVLLESLRKAEAYAVFGSQVPGGNVPLFNPANPGAYNAIQTAQVALEAAYPQCRKCSAEAERGDLCVDCNFASLMDATDLEREDRATIEREAAAF